MFCQSLMGRYRRCKNLFSKSFSANANGSMLVMECLKSRAVVRISGDNVEDYMQGLITNDMRHLNEGSPSMYAMFLNSRGRVLYDSIIYNVNEPGTFFIECDASASSAITRHLLLYKVRRKINVNSLERDFNIWALCPEQTVESAECKTDVKALASSLKEVLDKCIICCDPRLANLGVRIVAPKEMDVTSEVNKLESFKCKQSNFYKLLRYRLGVGEGVIELPPGNSFPLEANCDYLHGVSFHKGCYIGQELTARTYHTGVTRKRLMPIIFDSNITTDNDNDRQIEAVNGSEKKIGKIRGIEGKVGIGLLRTQEALKATELKVNGTPLKTFRPHWWPTEAQKRNDKNEVVAS